MPEAGSVSAVLSAQLLVTETVGGCPATPSSGSSATIVHGAAWALAETLSPATKTANFEVALVAGAGSIDLRALDGSNDGVVDGNGLKVQGLFIKAKATNGNPITIDVGDSDGYDLAGAAFSVTLQPGQCFLFYGYDATPDVAAGDKVLDLTGTGTDALQVQVVLG